jgi:hypothetical protein
LPAGEIEAFVVEEIKAIGRDPALVAATVAESRRLVQDGIKRLKSERAALERQRRADVLELARPAVKYGINSNAGNTPKIQERIGCAEWRLAEISDEMNRLLASEMSDEQISVVLKEFDVLWGQLMLKEQGEVLALLIEQVEHDGTSCDVAITFHARGLQTLAGKGLVPEETAA